MRKIKKCESSFEISHVNATFVHFLGALLLARKEQGRHDVRNMTLYEVHQMGNGESAWPCVAASDLDRLRIRLACPEFAAEVFQKKKKTKNKNKNKNNKSVFMRGNLDCNKIVSLD